MARMGMSASSPWRPERSGSVSPHLEPRADGAATAVQTYSDRGGSGSVHSTRPASNGGIVTRSRKRRHFDASAHNKSERHLQSGKPDDQQQCSEGKTESSSLRKMQSSLTAAMEHMEKAQIEFFHVERALKREKSQHLVTPDDVPWSVKVHFYCEFWEKFKEQLQKMLGHDAMESGPSEQHRVEHNKRSLDALDLLAKSVWGETRTSAREVFRSGPIVLAAADNGPHRPTSSAVNGRPPIHSTGSLAFAAAGKKRAKTAAASRSTTTSTVLSGMKKKRLIPTSALNNSNPKVSAAVSSVMTQLQTSPSADLMHNNEDVSETSSVQQRQPSVEVPLKMKPRRRSKYNKFPLLQQELHAKLDSDDERMAWPKLRLPFPRHHLVFDPEKYPELTSYHEKNWYSGIATYLEMVFCHPSSSGDRRRITTSKYQLISRQSELLSKYIEALGVYEVARNFLVNKDASFAFFFVNRFIELEFLSEKELKLHLRYVKQPWRSPITQQYQLSWWDMLSRKKKVDGLEGLQQIVLLSEAAKELLASAHFNQWLDFDAKWMRVATEAPWKTMLDAYFVQTETHRAQRRKPAKVKPRIKHEEANAPSSTQPAERLRWFQNLVDHLSDSTASEDDDSRSDQRPKLGKRLRTSK
ncbi:hypothetical protein FI667_g6028, partial [Globisporangium splendens]